MSWLMLGNYRLSIAFIVPLEFVISSWNLFGQLKIAECLHNVWIANIFIAITQPPQLKYLLLVTKVMEGKYLRMSDTNYVPGTLKWKLTDLKSHKSSAIDSTFVKQLKGIMGIPQDSIKGNR